MVGDMTPPQMADPTQEIALVTGAGSGLGAVIAEHLAAQGLTVAVNTRARSEEADSVAAAIRAAGGHAFPVTANVTDPAAVRRMFDTIAAHGRLRVLVNNASYRPRQRVQTITEEDWHQVRSVTLDGAFRCVRNALPALTPGGRIVNILGRNALAGDPERVHLSAAKHGLLGLTVALAAALRDDGVAVNALSPGVDSDGPELDRCRAEIASQVTRLAFADAAEVTGTVTNVDCDGAAVVTASAAW
jgi:NAD(P)-dependent dehydrogenase (short-subunit alcohol dehydrogenase family)